MIHLQIGVRCSTYVDFWGKNIQELQGSLYLALYIQQDCAISLL